jgi:3-oxoacyl-[acyl-carrier protein] reductase
MTSEVVVITGASRGIGRATAARFVARGARVVNLSRSPARLDGMVDLTVDLGAVDFEQTLAGPLTAAIAGCRRLVLVHNAAGMARDTARDVAPATLRSLFEVSLVAPAVLQRLLLPHMPRGSAIVYVGSTLSEKAVPGSFSYVTAKHAVVGMMRATCQDLMGQGIHTACVCPGITDTEMLRSHVGSDSALLETLRAMTGEGRLITSDEIARVIELVSDHPVLNGTVLHANLGQRER